MTETAAEATHQHQAELEQAIGQAAAVHQVGGQDEQRHRQQHIAVEQPVQDLLTRGAEVEAGDQQVEDRRADHRQPDRQSERGQRNQRNDAKSKVAGHHTWSPSVSTPGCGNGAPRQAFHAISECLTMDATAKMT